MQGQPMPMPQPGQMPSPEQIAAMQRQIALDAQKAGMTVPQFIEHLKRQAMEQQQARMQQMAQQQQQQGEGGHQHSHDHPHPHPHQQQGQAQPIVPGPPNPVAIALAKFLKGQDLKPRTCILNGERKDMFRVKRALRAMQSPAYEKARKKNPALPEITDRASLENTFKLLPISMLALRVSKADPHEGHAETIAKVDLTKKPFKYWPEYEEDKDPHTADAIIIATGASARRLGLPGEDKYWQNGISACAVCDGAVPIFRNKPLVVIGGGDSAAEEAMFLTKYGSHVTVLVRRDVLRASKTMAKRLLANKKVTVRFNTVGAEVKGDDKGLMSHMVIKNAKTGELETIEANGLFYAVGHDPATALFKGQITTDDEGYIITKPGTSYTNIEGVFAAGDVQDKRYRQAITSAGSGCIAALEAEKYLAEMEDGEENNLEKEKTAEKGNNVVVPEYRGNPLL